VAESEDLFRILSLDGGGAKGFYTLGVLKEVEAAHGPLHESFNLIFGTSTGSIIGSLLAIGKTVDEIHRLYRRHVPTVMSPTNRKQRSARLALLSKEVFQEVGFDAVKTGIGIVATKWVEETPLIFKADPQQAHGSKASFVPGFGVPLGEAVQASCSAYPLFDKKVVALPDGDTVTLIDGGFCANNPTLYAIADAVRSFEVPRERVRVLNVGVGDYPPRPVKKFTMAWCLSFFEEAEITQKTFNINTHSMEELRRVLFGDIQTVRVSEAFTHPSMMTDFLEHDLDKLNLIHRRGRESFGKQESGIRALLG
jgi:patatin-like phospholipase/acyl hydrolase